MSGTEMVQQGQITAAELKDAFDYLVEERGISESDGSLGLDFLIPGEPFLAYGGPEGDVMVVSTDMYEHPWYRLRRKESEEETKYYWAYGEHQQYYEPALATIYFRGEEVFFERSRDRWRPEDMRGEHKLGPESIKSFYDRVANPALRWREEVIQQYIRQGLREETDSKSGAQEQESRAARFIARWLRPTKRALA